MRKTESKNNKVAEFFRLIYLELIRIKDTPQRISLGFGLGVFSGILPGTGPIAALFLAFIFRANKASALLGSLLTNTWLSFLTFIFAVKLGSVILDISWLRVKEDWFYFLQQFHWINLLKHSVIKVIFPVMLGYFIIAFCLGLFVYLVTLLIIIKAKHEPR
jgi:hypothetical protein